LGACAVGPDYRPPDAPSPDAWHETTTAGGAHAPASDSAQAPASDSLASWWTTLGDPVLSQLVDQAIAGSPTVRQARARVVEARARRGIASGGLYPSLDASGAAVRTDTNDRGLSNIGNPDTNADKSYTVGLDAAWELDLFGGQRRSVESANAQ